jgi:hypothetical protein
MAAISQKEQLALHEFGIRLRAAHAKKNPTPEANIDTVKDAVREQYEKELETERTPEIGLSPTEERDQQQEQEREPERQQEREPEEPEP